MNKLFITAILFAIVGILMGYINYKALKKFKKLSWGWHTTQFISGHFVFLITAYLLFKDIGWNAITPAYITFGISLWCTFEPSMNKFRGKGSGYIGRTALMDKAVLRIFMGKSKYEDFMNGSKETSVISRYAVTKNIYFAIKMFSLMGAMVAAHLQIYYY